MSLIKVQKHLPHCYGAPLKQIWVGTSFLLVTFKNKANKKKLTKLEEQIGI